MRGLEKKRMKRDIHTYKHTNGHRDSMIKSAQWADSMKIILKKGHIGHINSKNISRENMQQKKTVFYAAILDHFLTKMFNSETTSFQHFSPRIPNL